MLWSRMNYLLEWFDNWELEKQVYIMILRGVAVVAILMAGLDYYYHAGSLAYLELAFAFLCLVLLYCARVQMLRYGTSSRIFIMFMALPIYWNLLYNDSPIESTILFIFLPIITIILRPIREVFFFAVVFGGSFLYLALMHENMAVLTYMELFKMISMQVLISVFLLIYVQTNRRYKELISQKGEELKSANEKLEALYREKEIEASTDALTGLQNRAAMMSRLEYLFARYKRQREVFSIILFDIDYFKKINDEHGHLSGDKVLQEIAKVTLECIREVDTAARYGGEEFMVLLPQTNIISAVNIAERIRQTMQTKVIINGHGVTASFGVAEIEEHLEIPALIKKADEALYEAKGAGRNQVISAY